MKLLHIKYLIWKEILELFLNNIKGILFIVFLYSLILNFMMRSIFSQGLSRGDSVYSILFNWFFALIPIVVILTAGSILIRDAFYREKLNKVLETLLATPINIKEIWLSKTIVIWLIAYFVFISASIFSIPIQSFSTKFPISSSISNIVVFNFFFAFPLLAFSILSLLCLLEFFLKNASMLSFFVIFFIFYPVKFLKKIVNLNMGTSFFVIFLSLLIFLLTFLGSHFLKKEVVIKVS